MLNGFYIITICNLLYVYSMAFNDRHVDCFRSLKYCYRSQIRN